MRIIIEFDTKDLQGTTPVIRKEGENPPDTTKTNVTGAIDAGASTVGSAQRISSMPDFVPEQGAPVLNQPGMQTAGSAPELNNP